MAAYFTAFDLENKSEFLCNFSGSRGGEFRIVVFGL
jgi:hypothetical protein